jgi:Tfp pilus assembly protein PilF
MVFSLLLAVSLALSPSAQETPTPATPGLPEAVEAANDGRDAEALAAFERVASADPDNLEARLWIARLHARMGDYDRAEPVYRSVLLEDPDNIAAVLGVADALLRRDEPALAIEVLEGAEELAANNGEVLGALGRAHRAADHSDQAITYLKRAVAVAPTRRHLLSLEAAQLFYLHSIEARAASEQFSGATPDSTLGDLLLNIRLTNRWRVLAQGQVQRKFRTTEERGGAGVEWRWTSATTLRAVALIGPNNRVTPERDYLAAVRHTYRATTWTATVRHFDFGDAETTVFSPAIAWTPENPLSLALGYTLSRTDTRTTASEDGHSAYVRAGVRVHPRLSIQAGYASGVEDFDRFSIDRIGDFRANTFSGGVRVYLPSMTAIVAQYDFEMRSRGGNRDMGRATVSLMQTF